MERIPTMGAYKQQSLIGPILPPNMPANRPSLAGGIRIHPIRHSARQPNFVSRLGLQLRKTPSAPLAVGLAAFDGNLLRPSALGSMTDSLQPLHANHRVWLRDGLAHTVRRVCVQPSFSSHQSPQIRFGSTSALRLQRTSSTGSTHLARCLRCPPG